MQIYIFFLFYKNKSDTIRTMAYISMFFCSVCRHNGGAVGLPSVPFFSAFQRTHPLYRIFTHLGLE